MKWMRLMTKKLLHDRKSVVGLAGLRQADDLLQSAPANSNESRYSMIW